MNDESKLPKWARMELDGLRRDLKRAEDEAKQLRGEWPESDAAIMDLGHSQMEERWLPKGTLVRFFLGKPSKGGYRYYVDVRVDRGNGEQLLIMGERSLCVCPRVSNVISIEAVR